MIIVIAACVCGCVSPERARQIAILRGLVKSQENMREYVKAQDQGFEFLSKDIAADKLKAGITKERVVEKYFEPISCRWAGDSGKREVCLFRPSTEYFSSDMAYLYFDDRGLLIDWNYQPR